jgi:nicotinamidase-related amidase
LEREEMEKTSRGTAGGTVSGHWGKDTERFYFERGLGGRIGFGVAPAIVVVDMQVVFNDPTSRLGADMGEGLEAIAELLEIGRERGVMIAYIQTAWRADLSDAGVWGKKIPSLADVEAGSPGVEIHPRIAPREDEHVVVKRGPSGFFGTHLATLLLSHGVDTVIVTGASTSGCVRATVVDSMSHGFRTIVPIEAVGDRADGPHWANLFDMGAKYADVLSIHEVKAYLLGLPHRREANLATGVV